MSWNERRAFSRSSATICRSMSSIRGCLARSIRNVSPLSERAESDESFHEEPLEERTRMSTPQTAAAAVPAAQDLMPLLRHRPRRALRRQRRAGRVLLHHAPSASARSPTRGLETGVARPHVARPRAGPHPARAHRRARRRTREIAAPPRPPRRRREGDRALASPTSTARTARRPRAAPAASPSRTSSPTSTAPSARDDRRPTATRCTRSSTARGYDGPFLPGLQARRGRRGRGRRRRVLLGDRPRRRQRRARPHGGVGQVLRGRLRHDRDDPLHRRGDLDRVLGADVEGRLRRRRAA